MTEKPNFSKGLFTCPPNNVFSSILYPFKFAEILITSFGGKGSLLIITEYFVDCFREIFLSAMYFTASKIEVASTIL